MASEINEVVLACHSGGGSPMLKLAIGNNKSKIIELWGFDCLYSGYYRKTTPSKKLFTQPVAWLNWAIKNPDKRLYIYYYCSTKVESEELRKRAGRLKLTNIRVAGKILDTENAKRTKERIKTQLNKFRIDPHFWVPITYWKDRLLQLPWI